MKDLVVLAQDSNAAQITRIASLLGITCKTVRDIPQQAACIILAGSQYDQYARQIEDQQHIAFVYDAGSSGLLAAQLKTLAHSSDHVAITSAEPAFTGSLTGLTLPTAISETVFAAAEDFVSLINLDQHPLLLMKGDLFLLASGNVLDIDTPAQKHCEPHREFFSSLLPFVLFIKWAFKDHCWHLNTYSACITVDDPLLQHSYGFVDFQKFNQWLMQHNLAATFAFIPWNYKRSNPQVIDLFKQNAARLSICVHGCDHTSSEFATTSSTRLKTLATTAWVRMAQHQAKYGLPHDQIMIFPQGKFSKEARQVLGEIGYVAEVGSGVFTTNYADSLTIRDLLDGVVLTDGSIPLYRRRYPVDVFDFACDVLFEKPVLITQHHQDFASYAPLQAFIQQLQAMQPKLVWMPLGDVITKSYWQKTEADGSVTERKFAASTPAAPAINDDFILKYTLRERLKVTARRYLSEFRDNVVHKNEWLKNLVRMIRSIIKK